MPAPTLNQKIKSITKHESYLSVMNFPDTFSLSPHIRGYQYATLVDDDKEAIPITVIGVVQYAHSFSDDSNVTISLEAEYAKKEPIETWTAKLDKVCNLNPLGTCKDFNRATRDNKMRFVRKKNDSSFDALELRDFSGELCPDLKILPGALVAVEFLLQVYKRDKPNDCTMGARLVTLSVQLLEEKYDPNLANPSKKVESVASPSPSKRRRFN